VACLPKTTGNRGIHVYVRLQPRWTSYEVRSAAVAVARELEHRRPDLITGAWWKEERGRRVFVDFNQNAPHKTIFGAWSVRARPGAQVSTPFAWDELDAIVPDTLLAELGLAGKLAGSQHNRVKAIRLRGELSEGLVYRPEVWPAHWTVGQDVAAELDIVEWEPPIPIHMAGAVEAAPKGTIFTAYTDIENVKRYPNVLRPGEPVAITEKLHGTCLCLGVFRDGDATRRVVSSLGMARGHKTLREDAANVYWRAVGQFDLFAALERFLAEAELEQAMLFGEVLGTWETCAAEPRGPEIHPRLPQSRRPILAGRHCGRTRCCWCCR